MKSGQNYKETSISVVIPVRNAIDYLPALLKALFAQKPKKPDEIILIDSQPTDMTKKFVSSYPEVRVIPIAHFSHGRARNIGVKAAKGDIIIFLTQDALPKDDNWLALLLAHFHDEQVGAAYSRQIPQPDAQPTERFFLHYHFPPGAPLQRSKISQEPLTFENVFFSNVSSAARRYLLVRYPFDENLIMSEDQQFARDIMKAGFKVVYEPGSIVIHSHCYSLKTVFQRYFDSVYSLTVIFPKHGIKTSAAIGLLYLGKEMKYILLHYPLFLPYYCLYTIAKASGTLAGHFADKIPKAIVKKLSLHSYHWGSGL